MGKFYCDKDTADDSDDEESKDEKNKYPTFNVTEDKGRIWKVINDKVVCYRRDKSVHAK